MARKKKKKHPAEPNLITPGALEEQLSTLVGKAVKITLTQNRVRMTSFRHFAGEVHLRLHERFLLAPQKVIRSFAEWILEPRRGVPPTIRDYSRSIAVINHPYPTLKSVTPRTNELTGEVGFTRGRTYDLAKIAARINQEFFNGTIQIPVMFGRDTSHQRVHSRRLGSYNSAQQRILIHPVLDNPQVPENVVAFTIYHEMLHSLQNRDQKRPHDLLFHLAERAFPGYDAVMKWRNENANFLAGYGSQPALDLKE